MRAAIFQSLFDRMATDETVYFLWADMGIGLVERFQEAYPTRTANVGICEQNLIATACGLWNVGFKPVVYTCSQFYLRAFEQIRLECGLNGAPIIMLGTTTGWDNAALGGTHAVTDDWAAMKAIPGIDIYCPSSVAYAETLLDRVLDAGRPAYVRIPKGSGFPLAGRDLAHDPGGMIDTVIVTYGGLVGECMRDGDLEHGAGVIAVNRLHPLPPNMSENLAPYDRIIVVEDQVRQGLYASICELQPKGRVEFVGPDAFDLVVGATPEAHWKRWGMTAEQLLERIACP